MDGRDSLFAEAACHEQPSRPRTWCASTLRCATSDLARPGALGLLTSTCCGRSRSTHWEHKDVEMDSHRAASAAASASAAAAAAAAASPSLYFPALLLFPTSCFCSYFGCSPPPPTHARAHPCLHIHVCFCFCPPSLSLLLLVSPSSSSPAVPPVRLLPWQQCTQGRECPSLRAEPLLLCFPAAIHPRSP